MFPARFLAQVAALSVLVLRANAESHTIKFVNNCGYGTPALMYDGENILTGDSYTSNGPWSGIAYLQTGYCNVNGENCTLLETTLIDPTCAGCGSSTDISLISPHVYSVETSFSYYNGCDGQGQDCSNADCTEAAFFNPNDNFVQVACQTNDVNLMVAFCADARQLVTGTAVVDTASGGTSLSSTPVPTSTSSLPASSLPTSSTPSLVSSANVLPVTPSSSSALSTSLAPTQPSTDVSDLGCGETGSAASAPTSTPTYTPTSTPTPTPTQTIPANSAPPSAPASAASRATTQSCRPRPSSLVPSNSVPTNPATAPTTVTPVPTSTPSTTIPAPTSTPSTTIPVTSAGAATGTSDPCGGESTSPSTTTPSVRRRRHRRANRIPY